jgi:glycosyltransferase involved in cell wall biosynthesis
MLDNNRLFLVLGMHRSGTSAVTRALSTMGINLGDHLMPPLHGNNDKGFWEDVDVNALNIDIQNFLQSDWHYLSAMSTADIEKLEEAGFITRACDLLRKKMDSFPNFGLKDPRVTKLLAFWKFIFSKLGCQVSYVIAVRNPISVAASLQRRDEIPTEKSLALWLEHTLISLNQACSARCIVVDYDRLMSSPKKELVRIAQALGLTLSEGLSTEYCSDFLDEKLRHSHIKSASASAANDFELLVDRAYRLASAAASDEVDVVSEIFSTEVNKLLSDYEKYSYFASLIDQQTSDITRLTATVSDHESRVSGLTDQVFSLTDQVASLTGQLSSVNGEKAALAGTVNELFHSTSWRVTAPLRSVGRRLLQLRRLRSAIAARGGLVAGLKQARRVFKRGGIAGVVQGLRLTVNPAVLYASGPESFDRNDYARWIRQYDTLTDGDRASIRREISQWENPPLISVVMPTFNTPIKFLKLAVESVQKQLYPHWELCIADDCSTKPEVIEYLHSIIESDSRVKVIFRQTNGHISAASNSALELVTGSWVALLDHDDELAEHALFCIAQELIVHPNAMLIYSDEDKIDEDGNRFTPHFKGDWNQELILAQNYISHLGVYKTTLLREVHGFRVGYEGSQDHDLILRCISKIGENDVRHVPRVLYHWRAVTGSTALSSNEKTYADSARLKAVEDYFLREAICAEAAIQDINNLIKISYGLPNNRPLVSLLIPTRDRLSLVEACVRSIILKTCYDNFEIIIIDNDSSEAATLDFFEAIQLEDPRVRVVRYSGPFNFSAINNFGVEHCKGSIVGLINNDIEVISSDWLHHMVGHAVRPQIGCVGAKLYYPNDTVQHGGVISGIGGVAGHGHKSFYRAHLGYFGRLSLSQCTTAVTAACLLIRKDTYKAVGGLNSKDLAVAFNDVEFCLRVRQAGFNNIWTPFAELYHHESLSRGYEDTVEKKLRFAKEVAYMQSVWAKELIADPYYNPNLTIAHEDFSLAWPPRVSPLTRR